MSDNLVPQHGTCHPGVPARWRPGPFYRPSFCEPDWALVEPPILSALREEMTESPETVCPLDIHFEPPQLSPSQPNSRYQNIETLKKAPDTLGRMFDAESLHQVPFTGSSATTERNPLYETGDCRPEPLGNNLQASVACNGALEQAGKRSASSAKKQANKCPVVGCQKSFKRREHLKRHLVTHTQDKSHVCWVPQCKRSFARLDNLRVHYKKSHIQKNGRSRYVATLDEQSPFYDPEFRGDLTSDGFPLYNVEERE